MQFSLLFRIVLETQKSTLFKFIHSILRYAHGVVPTISKYATAPIGVVKTVATAPVKSVYSQHDEYYVSIDRLLY